MVRGEKAIFAKSSSMTFENNPNLLNQTGNEISFHVHENGDNSFDSALATSTMQTQNKARKLLPVIGVKTSPNYIETTYTYNETNKQTEVAEQYESSISPQEPNHNSQKHMYSSTDSSISSGSTNAAKQKLHWESLEKLDSETTNFQNENLSLQNSNNSSLHSVHQSVVRDIKFSVISPRSLPSSPGNRLLPKLPLTGNKKSLFRTKSEPIPATEGKLSNYKFSRKTFHFDIKRLHSKKKKSGSEEERIIDEDLFFEPIEQKNYEVAKARGRRGAVVSLEINQTVSFVKYPGKTDRYCQFNFVPPSKQKNLIDE